MRRQMVTTMYNNQNNSHFASWRVLISTPEDINFVLGHYLYHNAHGFAVQTPFCFSEQVMSADKYPNIFKWNVIV